MESLTPKPGIREQHRPMYDIGRQFCCDAQRGIFYNDMVGSDPRT
jgi:hypothetical protein